MKKIIEIFYSFFLYVYNFVLCHSARWYHHHPPYALCMRFKRGIWISILGITGEVVHYGILFPWTALISATLSVLIVGNLFLPIFFKMRLTSVYEVCSCHIKSNQHNYVTSLYYSTWICVMTRVSSVGFVLCLIRYQWYCSWPRLYTPLARHSRPSLDCPHSAWFSSAESLAPSTPSW